MYIPKPVIESAKIKMDNLELPMTMVTIFFSKIIKYYLKKNINILPLYLAQVFGELKKNNHTIVYDTKLKLDLSIDLYIIISSIVFHEEEIKNINILNKLNKKIFLRY